MYDECEDCGHYDCQCEAVTGPVLKEKEMGIPDYNQGVISILGGDDLYAATLESVWDRAYFAALQGLCAQGGYDIECLAKDAAFTANITVAAWPAMTAECDALIRKAVEV